jgi:transposase
MIGHRFGTTGRRGGEVQNATVARYKELSEVERAFANLKDVLDMRPICHQTDEREQAHIFVAALAFTIHRAIEKS